MLQCFYPDKYIVSTYQINFDRLYEQGYRGIIFDIDNTLVEHGAPADERSIALFRHLKELGFRIMLLSNNKEPRVKMFNDAVQVQYLFKAGKPVVPDVYCMFTTSCGVTSFLASTNVSSLTFSPKSSSSGVLYIPLYFSCPI